MPLRRVVALILVFFINVATPFPVTKSTMEPWILYVAVQSTEILTLSFDPSKPPQTSLQVVNIESDGEFMPGWLMSHNEKIYPVSRTYFPTNNSAAGGVFAPQKHPALYGRRAVSGQSYSLELLSNASSDGIGGVYPDVSPDGQTLPVANM